MRRSSVGFRHRKGASSAFENAASGDPVNGRALVGAGVTKGHFTGPDILGRLAEHIDDEDALPRQRRAGHNHGRGIPGGVR